MPWLHELSPPQMALVSAALRHISDARTLLPSSPVQAMYLAGYGRREILQANQMSANFPVQAVDDDLLDGNVAVVVTAC